jgi:hypothetical protein
MLRAMWSASAMAEKITGTQSISKDLKQHFVTYKDRCIGDGDTHVSFHGLGLGSARAAQSGLSRPAAVGRHESMGGRSVCVGHTSRPKPGIEDIYLPAGKRTFQRERESLQEFARSCASISRCVCLHEWISSNRMV